MIINHNMMSMNAHRSMGVNQGGLGKNVEKLSTGKRINRAADDAAGLYISEKMRSQIRGLTKASKNSLDGVSAVQTAEGALDEVHEMLQRMRELVVQAGNDTNQTEDRDAIKAEINQLSQEIDSISVKTEFNKQKLLDGTFKDGKKLQVGANQDQSLDIQIESMSLESLGLGKIAEEDKAGTKEKLVLKIENNKKIKIAGEDFTMTTGGGLDALKTKLEEKLGTTDFTITKNPGDITIEAKKVGKDTIKVTNVDAGTGNFTLTAGEDKAVKGEVTGIQVDSYSNANESLGKIDEAIAKVSKQRSRLGAIQNRLEHTIKNLDNAAENTQAAEARIRDTDMAKQMSEFTKDNILTQASQAMLAQANQLPQQVLGLLR